jgi:PAS domain S-box-containing protein
MGSSGDGSNQPGQPPDRASAEDSFRHGEDHLRRAIAVTPALIHSGLPDGYLDFFNQTWLKYAGVSMGELQGWAWTAVIHPQDVEEIVNKWRASVASGDPFLREARLRRADGQYRWFSIINVPTRDDADRIVRWFGTGHDIEERKQRGDRLQLLVDSTPVHLQSARPDGSLDFFNKRWLE